MRILTDITLFFNVITIIVLAIGLFHDFKNPKHKAFYGYSITGAMIPFLLFLTLFIIFDLFLYRNILSAAILILCAASPFIIGKLVKYETLKKYTIIQILAFCLSFVIML